jgi:predicted RNA-binding Zn-ribbon protein involved in translation (DUF1610 family)
MVTTPRPTEMETPEPPECDSCGADLEWGVIHDCPVSGAPVLVTLA